MIIACGGPSLPNPLPPTDVAAEPDSPEFASDSAETSPDSFATGDLSDGGAEPETQGDVIGDSSLDGVEDGFDDTYDVFGSPWPDELHLTYGFAPLRIIVTRHKVEVGAPLPDCSSATGTLLDLENVCWRDNPTPSAGWATFGEETVEGPEWVSLAPLEPGYRYGVWLYAPDVPGAPPLGKLDGFKLTLYYYGVLAYQMEYYPAPVPHMLKRGKIDLIGVIDTPLKWGYPPQLRSCYDKPEPCAVAASKTGLNCHAACVSPVAGLPGALTFVTCPPPP